MRYCEEKQIPVEASAKKPYSMDRNLMHISFEAGILEDPWLDASAAEHETMYKLSVSPEKAPNEPEYVTLDFEAGNCVSVNGKSGSPLGVMETLNKLGGKHGIGRVDLVENRFVGMKSRGVYETPGGSLLYSAHSELEQLVLDRRALAAKDLIAPRYADLVYEGRWWTIEREAYDAFVTATQVQVSGTVALRLYKGSAAVVGRESVHALYDERFVTFGEDDVYQQSDAAGFIRLFALPARVRALKDQELARTAVANGSSVEQEMALPIGSEPAGNNKPAHEAPSTPELAVA